MTVNAASGKILLACGVFAFERILGKVVYGGYVVMRFDVVSIVTTKLTEFCAVIQNSDVTLDITTNMW